jgi:hypothetical protein
MCEDCERMREALESIAEITWCKTNGSYMAAWRECNDIARAALAPREPDAARKAKGGQG